MIDDNALAYPDNKTPYKDAERRNDVLLEAFRYVKAWDVAVDGGAYVGAYALEMALYFDGVVAFEPNPEIYACLERNCPQRRIACYPLALANTDNVRLGVRNEHGHFQPDPNGKEYAAVKLDVALEGINERVGLIKLDLEGGEYDALCGAEAFIQQHRPVLIIEEKHAPERAIEWLKEHGYTQTRKIGKDGIWICE